MNEDQKKEFRLALELIKGLAKINPEISAVIWVSVFTYIHAHGAQESGQSYEEFLEAVKDAANFYKHLWSKKCQK